MWEKPYYSVNRDDGQAIIIDVTTSCQPGLSPNESIYSIARFFEDKNVKTILDFGAGALRHTIPLLKKGFQVCAVEYGEQFSRKRCKEMKEEAEKNPNFNSLLFPQQFIKDKTKYDAAILAFVLTTMPIKDERIKLLNIIKRKLNNNSFIYWMSQYGKYKKYLSEKNKIEDGWFLHPERDRHSFYTEYKNYEVDEMLSDVGYTKIRSLGGRGSDQFRLYSRGGEKWPRK